MKHAPIAKKSGSSFCLFFLSLLVANHLAASDIAGFWKFTEESIQEIAKFTRETNRERSSTEQEDVEEMIDSYRTHIREFRPTGNNGIQIRLIQFENRSDRYPEYIREFDMTLTENNEGNFTISSGVRAVFSGRVSGDSMHLDDVATGKQLKMTRVNKADIPYLNERVITYSKLDRKPKVRKLSEPVYPPHLQNSGIEGVVEVKFMVNTDGTTSEIQILKSPHDDFSLSALEAIRSSTFRPGEVKGKPVRTLVKLPITFR